MGFALTRRELMVLVAGMGAACVKNGAKMDESKFDVPLFSVTGKTYREIGAAVGARFKDRINAGLAARKEWADKFRAFMEADPKARMDPFLDALRDEMPHLLEEMEGLAEGAGIPFNTLFAVALNPELNALMKAGEPGEDCTAAAVCVPGKTWIGHNEDGNCAYRDLMYLLDVTWPSGARSLSYTYPGFWPGNGPGVNSAGIAQTVNYIGARAVKPGLPRYAIDRAIVEAKSLDEALKLATHPRRAYSQHHYLLSRTESKVLSVETDVDKVSVIEVEGINVHANHYVHDSMKDLPQFGAYQGSSRPRQETAEAWRDKISDTNAITTDDLMALLTSHDNRPLSICRHPAPEVTGCTLGTAIIQAEEGSVDLYEREPCQGVKQNFEWPE